MPAMDISICNCIISRISFLLLFSMIFLEIQIKEIFAQRMSMEIWQKMYCAPDTLKCIDGHCCKYGEQYCSSLSLTCEPVFPHKLEKGERLAFCCEKLVHTNKTTSYEQLSTACSYLFGKQNFPSICFAKASNVVNVSESGTSDSAILPWTLFSISTFILIIIVCVNFARSRLRSKLLDEEKNILASSCDKDLTKQSHMNKETQLLLLSSTPTDSSTQLKQILVKRNNDSFDDIGNGSGVDDVLVDTDVTRDLEPVQSRCRDVDNVSQVPMSLQFSYSDEAPNYMQSSNGHLINGLKRTVFSPADQDGNTSFSPSGAEYIEQN